MVSDRKGTGLALDRFRLQWELPESDWRRHGERGAGRDFVQGRERVHRSEILRVQAMLRRPSVLELERLVLVQAVDLQRRERFPRLPQ